MSQADQVVAFKNELEALVSRYEDEFDMEPETLLGAIQCHAYLMMADITMCFVGTMAEQEDGDEIERIDGDPDDEGEEWKNKH
jgi:hypothetical protein